MGRNCLDRTILDSWVFDNFIVTDELFLIALRRLETCVSVNNNLCGKLISSLEYQSHLMKDSKLL